MIRSLNECRRRWKAVIPVISLLFYCLVPLTASAEHDIHISICEVRWNDLTSSFEVSIKVFIDDLELAMGKDGGSDLSIGTDRESEKANDHIAAYLDKHFKILLDGQPLQSQFLGKELSDDFLAIWCYIEYSGDPAPAKKCTLSNDVLLELYDDQRNIMDIRMSKTHKEYTIFQPGRSSWTYTY